jgi:tetratricopeptide (TPR) repeat protein
MSSTIERWDPPNDPEAFECLCFDLWKVIWQDCGAQKNGRSGQPQAGVDVFGRHRSKWIGIQCKQRDGMLRTKLTIRELNVATKAAIKFKPRLAKLIVATSAPRDQRLQEHARKLSDHNKRRRLFHVEVWSWEDIWHELYRRDEFLRRIAPTYWPQLFTISKDDKLLIAPTRLTYGAEQFVGRERDLQRIDEAWADSKTNVLIIVAWGGVGKTCLAIEWLAQKSAAGWPDFERVFEWSFYSQGTQQHGTASSDLFITAALEFFGDPQLAHNTASPWDKGARLARLVAKRRTLLVLDGLEPLQHPPGPMAGRLKDQALAALLQGLARLNSGLCLITSRENVADLAPFRATTAPEWKLEHLPSSTGVVLLKNLGVMGTEAEFRQLVDDVSGHALTLNLLGRYLSKAHNGNIRRSKTVRFEKADALVQGGHAFKAIAAYERWLARGGEGSQRQLAVLKLLGFFDRPADLRTLNALRMPPIIPNLTELVSSLDNDDDDDWNFAISDLQAAGLLKTSRFEPIRVKGFKEEQAKLPANQRGEPADFDLGQSLPTTSALVLDIHPLVREYFRKKIRDTQPETWREGHRRIYEQLKSSVPYWPEGLVGLQPLYEAIWHGCEAHLHQDALNDVLWPRIRRSWEHYSLRMVGAFSTELSALSYFFSKPWTKIGRPLETTSQLFLLSESGNGLRAQGLLHEAVPSFKAVLEFAKATANWGHAANSASNLSQIYSTLGNIAESISTAEESVTLVEKCDAPFARMAFLTALARALHQAGLTAEAVSIFSQAEQTQMELQPGHPLLYSLRGYHYCELMLEVVGEFFTCKTPANLQLRPEQKGSLLLREHAAAVALCDEVRKRAEGALAWYESAGEDLPLEIGLDYLILGRVLAAEAQLLSTSSNLRQPGSCKSDLSRSVDLLEAAAAHVIRASFQVRRASRSDYIPLVLLASSEIHFLRGSTNEAEVDLCAAEEIAIRGRMLVFQIDIAILRARMLLAQGSEKKVVSPNKRIKVDGGLKRRCCLMKAMEQIRSARNLIHLTEGHYKTWPHLDMQPSWGTNLLKSGDALHYACRDHVLNSIEAAIDEIRLQIEQ